MKQAEETSMSEEQDPKTAGFRAGIVLGVVAIALAGLIVPACCGGGRRGGGGLVLFFPYAALGIPGSWLLSLVQIPIYGYVAGGAIGGDKGGWRRAFLLFVVHWVVVACAIH